MASDVEYHLQRARSERDIAYRSADACASDAHMRLSALHLQQALLLDEVRRGPVGNVRPIRAKSGGFTEVAAAAVAVPLIELPSSIVRPG